jgi:hypothetical protein
MAILQFLSTYAITVSKKCAALTLIIFQKRMFIIAGIAVLLRA